MSRSPFYVIKHRDKGIVGFTTYKMLASCYIQHARSKEDLSFNNEDFPPGTKNLDDEAKDLAREALYRKLTAEDIGFINAFGLR